MAESSRIPVKNIFYMLAYVIPDLQEGGYADVEAERFERIHDLLALLLSRAIARQVKRGLQREYTDRQETLATLRGHLEMRETMRHQVARRRLLHCEYDELSENCLPNRILKTALQLLVRHEDLDATLRGELLKLLRVFSAIDTVDPRTVHWSGLRHPRGNPGMRVLMSLCRLLFEGLLMTTREGHLRLRSWLPNMQLHALYEQFILSYFKKEFSQIGACADHVSWALPHGEAPGLLPAMKTDITLRHGGKVLVIDAKYYRRILVSNMGGPDKLRSAHLYQIFSYVKNMEAAPSSQASIEKPVSGLLLYAAAGDGPRPDERYTICGSPIGVSTLDLGGDFSLISDRLDRIASEYFGLSR